MGRWEDRKTPVCPVTCRWETKGKHAGGSDFARWRLPGTHQGRVRLSKMTSLGRSLGHFGFLGLCLPRAGPSAAGCRLPSAPLSLLRSACAGIQVTHQPSSIDTWAHKAKTKTAMIMIRSMP